MLYFLIYNKKLECYESFGTNKLVGLCTISESIASYCSDIGFVLRRYHVEQPPLPTSVISFSSSQAK